MKFNQFFTQLRVKQKKWNRFKGERNCGEKEQTEKDLSRKRVNWKKMKNAQKALTEKNCRGEKSNFKNLLVLWRTSGVEIFSQKSNLARTRIPKSTEGPQDLQQKM